MKPPLASMHVTSAYGPRGAIRLPDNTIKPAGRHDGVDLRAAVGTVAVAIVSGRVSHISYSPRGALQLFLLGDDGTRWAYVHLDDILEPPGAVVVEGQPLVKTGESGGVAPHLHLECRIRGRLVDPMLVLAGKVRPGGGSGVVAVFGVAAVALMMS